MGVDLKAMVRPLHVVRQGEWDSACGLYCVVSAARFFRVPEKHLWISRIVHRGDGVPNRLLVGPGGRWTDLREMASRARLVLEEETRRPRADAMKGLWIARGMMMFSETDPDDIFAAGHKTNVWGHYVLARVHDGRRLLIEVADPHPWHRERRMMTVEQFEEFCTTAARIKRRWP